MTHGVSRDLTRNVNVVRTRSIMLICYRRQAFGRLARRPSAWSDHLMQQQQLPQQRQQKITTATTKTMTTTTTTTATTTTVLLRFNKTFIGVIWPAGMVMTLLTTTAASLQESVAKFLRRSVVDDRIHARVEVRQTVPQHAHRLQRTTKFILYYI